MPDSGGRSPAGGELPAALRIASARKLPAPDGRSNTMLALDFETYMPGSVLAKVDRASMAHGLEVRPPMLDNAMIDFASSIPASVRLSGGTSKALLKRAAAGLLPREIIRRRKKGFAIPLARWIAGPLKNRVHDVLASSPLWDTGLLDARVFAGWLNEHVARAADRSRPLWAMVVLDHWLRAAARPPPGVENPCQPTPVVA